MDLIPNLKIFQITRPMNLNKSNQNYLLMIKSQSDHDAKKYCKKNSRILISKCQ